jgi:hypothetical protein
MITKNINNRVNISRIIDINYFIKRINEVKDMKRKPLIEKVFSTCYSIFPKNWRNRDDFEDMLTGAFTPEELFSVIHKKDFNPNLKSHKNNLADIENKLELLSQTWKSVYKYETNLIVKEKDYYYVKNWKHHFNKIGYTKIDLGMMDIKPEILHKYKFKVHEYLTGVLAAICFQNIVFNYSQIEMLFGISKSRIRKIWSELGISTITVRSQLNPIQKSQLDIQEEDNQGIDIGIKINYMSDKYIEVLTDVNAKINFDTLYKMRKFTVKNKQYLTVDYFKDESGTNVNTLDEFMFHVNRNIDYDDSIENRESMEFPEKRFNKHEKFNNLMKSYDTKDWYYEERRGNSIPKKEKDKVTRIRIFGMTKFTTYDDFCKISRIKWKEFLESYEDFDYWPNFVKMMKIEVERSGLPQLQTFLNGLNTVKDDTDILKSPLFNENWYHNSELDNVVLDTLYKSMNENYNKRNNNIISDSDLSIILSEIVDHFKKNPELISEENYNNKVDELIDTSNLTSVQKKIVENKKKYINKILFNTMKTKFYNVDSVLEGIFSLNFKNVEEIENYIRVKYEECFNSKIKDVYRCLLIDIKNEMKYFKKFAKEKNSNKNSVLIKENLQEKSLVEKIKEELKSSELGYLVDLSKEGMKSIILKEKFKNTSAKKIAEKLLNFELKSW